MITQPGKSYSFMNTLGPTLAIIPRFCRFCSCLEDGILSRMSPTGVILTVLFSKIPRFTNWGILENSTVKITPVGDIQERMPSSRQEQNQQNRGIMFTITTEEYILIMKLHREYRDRLKCTQILLSRTKAGLGRSGKQEQEQISRNHVEGL